MPDPSIEEGWPSKTWMAYMEKYIHKLTAKDFATMSRAEMFCIDYYFLIAKYEALEEARGPEMWRAKPNMPVAVDEWAIPNDGDASEPF